MEEKELKLIWGSEQIIDWFGYWPSFHDAEIHWIKLQRGIPGQSNGSSAELLIHTYEITEDKDERGFLDLRKHCLIHLRLEGCTEVKLEGFGLQNILFGLDFKVKGLETTRSSV